MKKEFELKKDKETKGTFRFTADNAFGPGRHVSIYVPKGEINVGIESIKMTLEWE